MMENKYFMRKEIKENLENAKELISYGNLKMTDHYLQADDLILDYIAIQDFTINPYLVRRIDDHHGIVKVVINLVPFADSFVIESKVIIEEMPAEIEKDGSVKSEKLPKKLKIILTALSDLVDFHLAGSPQMIEAVEKKVEKEADNMK